MATARRDDGCLGIVVALILVALLYFPGSLIYYYTSSGVSFTWPSFDISSSSIALVGTPGMTTGFNLTGSSINNLWASDGLNLELHSSSGFDETFDLIGYTAENWGDTISCSGPSNCVTDFTIDTTFTLPSALAESADRTLSGSLSGDITTPQPTPDGNFENNQKQLNIPVSLKIGIIRNNGLNGKREISLIGTLVEVGLIVTPLAFAVRSRAARRAVAGRASRSR
jgi:hypothetical protein